MDTLSGSIERITFYNQENGYSVLRLKPEKRSLPGANREGLVTIVGNLPELAPGQYLNLSGRWENHPHHGLQFMVDLCEQSLPATCEGMRRYLGSGLIKGIGPRLAERIIARFGDQTFDTLENHPDRLIQVADIGQKRLNWIKTAWHEQKQIKEIMFYLHSRDLSTSLAIKIYQEYGERSLDILQADPYRLARDITGIGFKTADRIATALGLPEDHPSRIEAGVIYCLNEQSNNGHVFLPQEQLLARVSGLLNISAEQILPALEALSLDERVRVDLLREEHEEEGNTVTSEQLVVYLAPFYQAESAIASRIKELQQAGPRLESLQYDFTAPGNPQGFELSSEQHQAIHTALTHPVSILTGGPGTGKTTAIQALIAILEKSRKTYALASPTGRGAKRLSQATGRQASTIHRLLEYSSGLGWQRNETDPLDIDMLVIDEVSMLDTLLANHLLKAIKPSTHLLLIGDVDQLPSVGPGDVLRDLIDSGQVPVVRLGVIFRQASGSQIVTNAHRINHGVMPLIRKDNRDFFLFPVNSAEEAATWVKEVVTKRIPERFGLNPIDQIQVVAPMYRGAVGVDALNISLQAVLNPPNPRKIERTFFGQTFRLGDKLMQIHNNYDLEVFNGDIGKVSGISVEDRTLTVDFESRPVSYDWTEANQLVLAYAITVHKAQGSEFPAVVLPLVTQHYPMLQRNLLYTAVTRARQLCVLIGDKRALAIATRNHSVSQRCTALDLRLRSLSKV
jgi:exodeoxyribonuclease V alpha subunit